MSGGGYPDEKSVFRYQEPVGPKNMYRPGPGLRGGDDLGQQGTQENSGSAQTSGSPYNGTNHGNAGTQGRR